MTSSTGRGASNAVVVFIGRWLPVALWMALIFYLSSRPWLPRCPGIDALVIGDKIKHVLGYAVLGALIWRALGRGMPSGWRVGLTVLLSALYGMSDEWHQTFVPGRECDVFDLTADTLGGAIAAVVLTIRAGGDNSGEQRGAPRTGVRGKGQEAG